MLTVPSCVLARPLSDPPAMAKPLRWLAALLLLTLASAAPLSDSKRAVQVPVASHVVRLTKNTVSGSRTLSSTRIRKFRALTDGTASSAVGIATALPVHYQAEYLVEVNAGGNNYSLLIDTGSSDTWFVRDDFQCLDAYLRVVHVSYCNLGPYFKGDFPGGRIPEQHFNITYGGVDGPFLNGLMGYSEYALLPARELRSHILTRAAYSLTVAGVTIPKQQIALATLGIWTGDGISSGILGLGLPGLTEAFVGKSPIEDGLQNLVNYSPVVTTVATQLNKSIFSLGLSRNSSESFLALGGVPHHVKVGSYANVPIQKMPKSFGGSDYFYYALTPDSLVWNSSRSRVQQETLPQVIVDSGTSLNVFPYGEFCQIARSINEHFIPKAVYTTPLGGWFVPCNAKPPSFGVKIGGQMFWTDPASMILPEVRDLATGNCATGIGATDDGSLYILGDVFMQGLVAVFDVGPNMEMRFAKRI
ncbi:aspartic peptidase domain-containing protein [Lasiosphaeris hirsuta]|uniref:Aspartic peptidase domain-containing protein n=1 Tax=Lasiosphaeris hirsuta TaxID=260670 RepID=A0AA40ARI4_9PEZI|nr:aspartic peptidase domain-containing protein [Lasiosphaeris hirsuta]